MNKNIFLGQIYHLLIINISFLNDCGLLKWIYELLVNAKYVNFILSFKHSEPLFYI